MSISDTRQSLLKAALELFEAEGYAGTTVAQICLSARVSNGSFFHHFGSKEGLAGALFVEALRSYHAYLLDGLLIRRSAAAGVERLVRRHLEWVFDQRPAARFLFEQHRAEWLGPFRDEQAVENATFVRDFEAWRSPWAQAGRLTRLPSALFFSQLIGPAQMLCRAWLSGSSGEDPRLHASALANLAVRALVPPPPRPHLHSRNTQ